MKKYLMAFSLFLAASSGAQTAHNDPLRALADKGIELYKQEKYDEALPILREATAEGHMKTSRYLGLMYLNGKGLEKSADKAFAAFKVAADRGDITSQYWLGYLYEHGIGVKKDMGQAIQWYKKSAARGDEISQPAIDSLKRLKPYGED